VDLTFGYWPMHTMKLVVDLNTDRYVRFILNETEYDLSAYSANTFANPDQPHLGVKAILYSTAGFNADCWVDDIILTQNEPP